MTNRNGTVLMWAVTSCDDDFQPSFSVPSLSSEGGYRQVVLRESKLGNVVPERDVRVLRAHYFVGVTGNTAFFDVRSGGNPGNYQSFAWGWSDACVTETNSLFEEAGYPALERGRYDGFVGDANSSIKSFRERAPVNSYAETAPGITFDELTPSVQIGADRLLTRTAP